MTRTQTFGTIARAFALLAALTIASCGDDATTGPGASQWGVGGELVFDAYSLEPSGFWKSTPDSTVRYTLIADNATRHGRTNVRVFASTNDTILLARTANGDAEAYMSLFEVPVISIPTVWAPLPVTSHRDTTFMTLDTTISLGIDIRINGSARAGFAGNEEVTVPNNGPRLQVGRVDILADASATVAIVGGTRADVEGSVYFAPAENIVTRTDLKTEIIMPGSSEKTTSGVSMRLKQVVYPGK